MIPALVLDQFGPDPTMHDFPGARERQLFPLALWRQPGLESPELIEAQDIHFSNVAQRLLIAPGPPGTCHVRALLAWWKYSLCPKLTDDTCNLLFGEMER